MWLLLLFTFAIATPSVTEEWSTILKDHFLPFNSTGITKTMIDDLFLGGGSHVLFQYINQTLRIVDPTGYCLCNKTNYTDKIRFPFHLPRCQIVASLISESLKSKPKTIDFDFELVWSVDDLPTWTTAPSSSLNWHAKPGFGSIRCPNKGGFSFPFFGSHHAFDLKALDLFSEHSFHLDRKGVAIFRGSIERGCSFERDTVTDFNGHIVFSMQNRSGKCGRPLLYDLAKKRPDRLDYQIEREKWISLDEQERLYKYVISVEGYGGWTDRLFSLIRRSMIVFDQEHPCDQWFEPMLKPFLHYIPISHDFRNLVGRVDWANQHPNAVKSIQREARKFAKRYLSSQGVLDYISAILQEYQRLIIYKPMIRKNSYPITILWDSNFRNMYCQI